MMTADTVMGREDFVRLSASSPLRSDPRHVAALLARGAEVWGGEPVGGAPAGLRRFSIDLRLRVGGDRGGLTTLRKAALVDLGPVLPNDDGWEVEVAWRAASAAPLFPVFGGRLVMVPGQLRLEGVYAPPGGVVGRVADRVLLHLAANGTARWLLAELARVGDAAG